MGNQVGSLQRNQRIDLLKGCLILLVIIGHIVLGHVHEQAVRYMIYSFHMPLFIGLSGYLINPEKLRQTPLIAFAIRYWWRVLFPFTFGVRWLRAPLVRAPLACAGLRVPFKYERLDKSSQQSVLRSYVP